MEILDKVCQKGGSLFISLIIFFLYLSFMMPRNASAASTLVPFNDNSWKYYDLDAKNNTPSQYILNSDEYLNAAGADVWTANDEFVDYYQNNLSGDWDVVVKVVSQENTNSWAKAGLMVKNNLRYSASDSNGTTGYCMVAVTPGNGYVFQWDSDANKYLDSTTTAGTTTYPVWLRLKKVGTTFTGYYSHSSNNPPLVNEWTQIASRTIASANNTQDIGLFVTGHNTADFCEVRFSKFYRYDHSLPVHTITATAGANGSISPSGAVSVTDGLNQIFSITPNTGYNIQSLTVDGSSVAVQASYTFSNVTADHTISAAFVITTNNITASFGANGSISPSGATAVNYGSSQTFTVTPNGGYRVNQVLVDGVTASLTNNAYAFSNVTGAHTISVTFAQITHNVTSTADAHGSITPSGVTAVADGGSQLYSVSVDNGYYVASFKVDETSAALDVNKQYTLTNVTADHNIKVTFAQTQTITNEIPGCGINTTNNNSGGFNAADFTLQNISVDPTTKHMVLQTGNQAINPESIIIPFKQEVAVTFIYEGAGYVSDFGYVLKQDAVNADGSFKTWNSIALDKRHPIFHNVNDDNETGGCCGGGDGIFDTDYGNVDATHTFPTTEAGLIAYNAKINSNPNVANAANANNVNYGDGTGLPFAVDGDGALTPKDMRKVLGTFDAGTELVFFLSANKEWTDNTLASDIDNNVGVWFTKKDWNNDSYHQMCTQVSTGQTAVVYPQTQLSCDTANGYFAKSYYVDVPLNGEGGCKINSGWLMQPAVTRLSNIFNVNLDSDGNTTTTISNKDVYPICVKLDQKYSHNIVGAPANDPNQWILGWEDLRGSSTSDADHNDMVFKIDRKTGGVAQLQSQKAIVPTDNNGNPVADAYFTAVTMEVWDDMPCHGKTKITYWVSIDNGTSWYEITTWDTIKSSDANQSVGSAVANWTPGTPEYTYRSVKIDFAGLGKCGNQLIWKAQLESQDQACAPSILNVSLNGTVATNGSFSRSSPIILANMSYSGSYETPALNWTDKTILRGHLRATRIYDPLVTNATSAAEIWDAGATLNSSTVDSRKIYFPNVTVTGVVNEGLGTGDGSTVTFTGKLAHHPVSATTVKITNTIENFVDMHTNVLQGSLGGTGTINRYTGDYQITFHSAPAAGVPIKASYSYYTTAAQMPEFKQADVTSGMLGLDNTYVVGKGFTYDFNNDGKFDGIAHDGTGSANDSDGDWLVEWIRGYKDGSLKTTKKEWLLGAIDHSVPAVESPPGMPKWYFGTDITESERKTYSDFKTANAARNTAVYVGARDGMIHAFNAGQFRWGDNPDTKNILENRGYFKWTSSQDSNTADYGNGSEMWAFIPANLLPRLKNNILQPEDGAMVDASPTLADVYINGQWRTILACAEGNGGDTVFCLDVTDPNTPTFMWEFADPDLFRSRSSPTVGLGRMIVGGTPKWVALFVSGKSSDPNAYPSIYIVDIETGNLIENGRVYLDDDPANDGRGRGGVPSGQPAIVDSDGNGFIDRVYIGTDKGFLYKVNLPDDPKSNFKQITHCIINSDFSYTDTEGNAYVLDESQRYHPIYASPTVTVNNTLSDAGAVQYNINVFFGTGDSPYYDENINIGNTRYHFFAYSDKDPKGECGNNTTLSWYYELPAGQRVWASAFASAGQIFFGTSTAETEEPCDATAEGKNEGQLFVFTTSGTPKKAFNTGNIVTSPVVEDEHIYFRTSDGLNSMGSNVYNNKKTQMGTGNSSIVSWEEVPGNN
jgi:type IV pilus assembly protein PilY1